MRAGIPVGLVGAILLSIATVAVVFARAFGSQGQGWSDILAFLPFLTGGIALGLLLNFGYGQFARSRRQRLARDHAHAVVFSSEMTPALRKYLQSDPERHESPELTLRTPHYFTVVASSDGLSMWSGWASRPTKFWHIGWASILDIRPEVFPLQFKSVHGLHLHTGEGDGALQIAPFPELSVAVSWDQARVNELADVLSALRTTALQR